MGGWVAKICLCVFCVIPCGGDPRKSRDNPVKMKFESVCVCVRVCVRERGNRALVKAIFEALKCKSIFETPKLVSTTNPITKALFPPLRCVFILFFWGGGGLFLLRDDGLTKSCPPCPLWDISSCFIFFVFHRHGPQGAWHLLCVLCFVNRLCFSTFAQCHLLHGASTAASVDLRFLGSVLIDQLLSF